MRGLWVLGVLALAGAEPADCEDCEDQELLQLQPPRGPLSARIMRGGPLLARHYVAPKVSDETGALGKLSRWEYRGHELEVHSGNRRLMLSWVTPRSLRIRLLRGQETEGIVNLPKEEVKTEVVETGQELLFSSGKLSLHLTWAPLMLRVTEGPRTLWRELKPIAWNSTSIWQTLEPGGRFFGGGMQNAYTYDHTGRYLSISAPGDDDGWDAGSRANAAPFFISTRGYGALRNTFKPGGYDFADPILLSHDELGLDVFYFHGSIQEVLESYTSLAGRPLLPPLWGLFLGDSDCYNNKRHDFNTFSAVEVAENYTVHDMPRGWMLVNDGYGCGYTSRGMLMETQEALHQRGLRMGLWTSTGLSNASWEISRAGSRVIKTDVAWVWEGYDFGLDAVKLAAELMIEHSDSRPFTWTVCGWAGTQKYAVLWTGDNSGSWDYIKMQIPTIIGSGLSGFAHASGDVDGIFRGSAETYVRDLQWKTFLSVSMYMSGWSRHNKQPWAHGEPFTTYNRRWLQLRARLTPYLYSLSMVAHKSGLPVVRAMELEFDEVVNISHQFMSGPFFLVAPVYENRTLRDVQLPRGTWIDYADPRSHFKGPQVLSYHSPLETLPVFVRSGAIVPMWPLMNYVGEKEVDPLTLDLYPGSEPAVSSFTMYEDDGLTRNYTLGHVAQQVFSLQVQANHLEIRIGASEGLYHGKPETRSYWLQVHSPRKASEVLLGQSLLSMLDGPCHESGPAGWCHGDGIIYVKTPQLRHGRVKIS